ncbi:MAG TPA: serpin family protein, partial [Gemmatimonadaceae bacterium]|nr:serpin family protein [Gemmatimonadaceae bacterium]
PYRGERIAMYVVLPDTGAPSGALGAAPPELTPEHFRLAAAALERRPVALQLPRFTVDCTADLVAPLSALGAVAAFDPDRADFRPLFAPGAAPRRAWISRVVQRTYVQVNEEGTKAAAVTAIDIATDTSAAPPPPTPFVVDRAFVFAIRDDGTGALLFLGRVADPDRACGGE